jgi:hypothetical protein
MGRSVIGALQTGRTSWTHLLDAVRLGPDEDATDVTAFQIRDLVTRLCQAGAWHEGDQPALFTLDAGYDVIGLSYLLDDLPVTLVARIRADRVMRHRPPALVVDDVSACPTPGANGGLAKPLRPAPVRAASKSGAEETRTPDPAIRSVEVDRPAVLGDVRFVNERWTPQ